MPHGYDPTCNTGMEGRAQRFLERPAAPVSTKPPPPEAPPAQRRPQENLMGRDVGGTSGVSENQSGSSAERDTREERRKISREGLSFLGFGLDSGATYEQAWTLVMKSQKTLNEVLKDCNLFDDAPLKFSSWFRRKRELMRRNQI